MDKKRLMEFARSVRADLIGVAGIDRFKDVDPQHNPCSIFPEARSVIVVGKRVVRGALRGVEEGTQFGSYNFYGYQWLNNRVLALTTFRIAEFLEDNGYEAVPFPGLPPQIPPMGIPVRKGKPAPNVIIDVEDAAVRAGLGEFGYCGIFLTEEFGPRQRFQVIITDASIEEDPIKEDNICDLCKECLKICPLGAIGSEEKTLQICGKKMVVADINFDICSKCKNGAFPNMFYENAHPDRIAALCARTCLSHLEDRKRIKNLFSQGFRKRSAWKVDKYGEPIKD